jgi:hypothetical protein
MNYPRYQPRPQRPRGAGAFFDWTVFVANHDAVVLKSCRIDRRRRREASGVFAPTDAAKSRLAP